MIVMSERTVAEDRSGCRAPAASGQRKVCLRFSATQKLSKTWTLDIIDWVLSHKNDTSKASKVLISYCA